MNIAFELSGAFKEFKVGLSRDEARQEVVSRAEEKGIDRPADEIDEVTALYERASATLLTEGVVYAASCHGQFDDERSTGSLTVGLSPLAYADASVAVAGIREVMSKKHADSAEISMVDLTCGQAVVVIQQTPALRIPGEFTTTGEEIPVDVAQLQAFIPPSFFALCASCPMRMARTRGSARWRRPHSKSRKGRGSPSQLHLPTKPACRYSDE